MSQKTKTILAIETSCDDTSVAILKCSGTLKSPKFKVVKNIVSSQIAIHRPFGGVVPNIAKREHTKNLPTILKSLKKKKSLTGRQSGKTVKIEKIDVIAVTVGPGLEPALWAGITFAEDLAKEFNKPLIGVNHMEGHLYSNWLSNKKTKEVEFPAIALIVSGGHTIILKMTAINKWKKLGETIDDAAGEAFDKVARMLKLPYPGGPEIQKLATKGDNKKIKFPRPLLNPKHARDKYNFSFSGLKTSVLYYLRDNPRAKRADVAASFQQAVVDVLTKKTISAVKANKSKSILLCGGVAASKPLRESLQKEAKNLGIDFIAPNMAFNTDNGVMIAAAAYLNSLQKNKKKLPIKANGGLSI